MLRHKTEKRPEYVYAIDEWRMIERQFYPRLLAASETIFATANGYLGMRGNFEEGSPVFESGTYVNGFYESWPITYGEEAYGFAKTGQTMLNVTDSKIIKLYVDDEPFYLASAHLLKFERVLDMRAGTLDREVLWETPAGKQVVIKSRRLVSLQQRHLAAISYEVTILNAEAPITISSEMLNDNRGNGDGGDPRRPRGITHRALSPRAHYADDMRVMLSHVTQNSKMTLACGIDHSVHTACTYTHRCDCAEDSGQVIFTIDGKPGEPVRLVKYMTYHTSSTASAAELRSMAQHDWPAL
jgi:alpha,alpha-trehalose phosphorylase